MKLLILSILSLLLHFPVRAENPGLSLEDSIATGAQQKVLIINSYHPETIWGEEIVDGLKTALRQRFQNLHIYSGNLNIEEAQSTGTVLLSLRAIIWQMAEKEGDTIAPTSKEINSFYRMKKVPDVIVLIGEEAFFEHAERHLQQGKWSDVPLVCCAMNDSIIEKRWHVGNPLDISDLRSADERLGLPTVFVPDNDSVRKAREKSLARIGVDISVKARREPDGKIGFATSYHSTGVLAEVPVRKNLELLKVLMPKLEEIVWVDDYYYKNAYALYRLRQELPRVLPGVTLSVICHNGLNTDSIYDVMLKPAENRIFVTYAWKINGVFSRRPEQEIDSLFSNLLTSPILSFTERLSDKNYWLGGTHFPTKEIVEVAAGQISRILQGVPVDSIPYVKITRTETNLNVPALERFDLLKNAKKLEGVNYKNIPPSFYKRHEKAILFSMLALIILSGGTVLIVKRMIYARKIQGEYLSYHRLYKRLQAIYLNSDIDFALYDGEGMLISKIINGQENDDHHPSDILSEHLFLASWMDETIKQRLRELQSINQEIELDRALHGEKSRWNLIINPLQQSSSRQKACYIAIAIDLTPLVMVRKSRERSEHILQFVTQTAGIGVASYNLLSGQGLASSTWFWNLKEPIRKNHIPTYENVCEEDRAVLLAHIGRIRKEHVTAPFIQIIRVKDPLGGIHYVQQYIFVREFAPEQQSIVVTELNLNYDEPHRREKQLRKAKEQAEASNLETEQFLANISHEIRTPLNAIVGFSSILANSDDKEEIDAMFPIIEQNNKLLISLIDNILYLSKLDSGTLDFDYALVSLEPLFDKFIAEAMELAGQKKIVIEKECSPDSGQVCLAETQFCLVMSNLISNAVKFTSQGTIIIGYEKREQEHYFFVRDTGEGIDPADQKNIFKRFNKLDNFTQGTGLGLSLCHSIVTHQQGNIGVVSQKGKGSVFWFTLPDIPESGA